MLIVGESGSGKTTLLMRLLLEDGLLNYENLYVFSRSLHQPEYQCLIHGLNNGLSKATIVSMLNSGKEIGKNSIEEIAKAYVKIYGSTQDINAEFYSSPENIPDPTELDREKRNLMVFDDIMTDRNQGTPESYFTRGRTCNCDSIYLSQNYIHLPLHTIRSNSNIMIFLKLSPLDKNQVFIKFASIDMNKKDFDEFCRRAWSKKYGYLVIDTTLEYDSGNKYRFDIEIS